MRKRKGLFLDKYIQVERIALIIFALAGLVFLIYISTINQDSESGASSDRPSADVSFDPGDRPFETLRVDEVPGIAFLDQYGYGYSTKDADEIAASVGFLNGISVLDRYEREGE
ncbi:MAG: hypothetical protein LBT52_04580, partial [Clostridiales Family XIII bacterium]|nr:hypothetical protein [Clostridiales Family XIII bacterium]